MPASAYCLSGLYDAAPPRLRDWMTAPTAGRYDGLERRIATALFKLYLRGPAPVRHVTFLSVYTEELAKEVARHPDDYMYGPEGVAAVAEKMAREVGKAASGYMKDSAAWARTAKRLGIPNTYAGFNGYAKAHPAEFLQVAPPAAYINGPDQDGWYGIIYQGSTANARFKTMLEAARWARQAAKIPPGTPVQHYHDGTWTPVVEPVAPPSLVQVGDYEVSLDSRNPPEIVIRKDRVRLVKVLEGPAYGSQRTLKYLRLSDSQRTDRDNVPILPKAVFAAIASMMGFSPPAPKAKPGRRPASDGRFKGRKLDAEISKLVSFYGQNTQINIMDLTRIDESIRGEYGVGIDLDKAVENTILRYRIDHPKSVVGPVPVR